MASQTELTLVIEAQDRASQHLRSIGQDVARLERQVEGLNRSSGSGGGLLGGLRLGAGFAAAQQGFEAMGGVFQFIKDSVVTLNAELERNVATFEQVTGSVAAAGDVVRALRQEAARSPFSDREILDAGQALIAVSDRSTESLLELVRVAEVLASIDPAQGFEGATVALREALSGDFGSFIRRFEASREAIQRFKDQGVSNLEIVRRELERMGYTAAIVERLGQTFEGRTATIRAFFDELRQRAGAGVFDRLNELLGGVVRLIDEFGDRLRVLATGIGSALGAVAERIGQALTGPLRALTQALAPGLWDEMAASMGRMAPAIEATTQAAARAAPAVEDVTRTLARAGVAAAELGLDADRVRRAYDDQIQPLERQLRLLQQSGDLQRIQNALATNRGTVERLRLEQEIAALQRAAGGATDPNTEGLTLRQRMIALALQERELRRDEIDLEGQRRPQIQTLEQQLARLQEEQRKALEPLERSLALRRDEIASINLVRQQEELLAKDVAATAKARQEGWTSQNPGALDEVKKRGEELAQSWLDGWQKWIDEGGGSVWSALLKSLNDWWEQTGRPTAIRIGAELGVAIGAAAGVALQAVFGPQLARLEQVGALIDDLERRAADFGRGREGAGEAVPGLDPVVRARSGLPPLVTGTAGVSAQTAQTSPSVTVNMHPGAVSIESTGMTAEDLRRARDETVRAITEAFAQTAASTDPGARPGLQGAGRAP